MTSATRSSYLTREKVLKLLSDDEVAKVSTAETVGSLPIGDEYLDLERLDLGVRRALAASAKDNTPSGRVLPKKAVHAATWAKLVAQAAPAIEKPHLGA